MDDPPARSSDLDQLFLITAGGGAMQVEDRWIGFTAPALLLVPVGVVHGLSWTADSSGTVVTLARSRFADLFARHPALSPIFDGSGPISADADMMAALRTAADNLRRELGGSARGRLAAVDSALLAMLVAAVRAIVPGRDPAGEPGRQAALVARFRSRIERRFHLREGVAVHAAALGTSHTSLRAAGARIAGLSPAAMLDRRAMLEARRALLHSNLSVAQVGYALSFADPAYFSRFFTRHAGQSPRLFRLHRADVTPER